MHVGDKVITSKYSGTQVKLDGEEVTIVRQNDILAVVIMGSSLYDLIFLDQQSLVLALKSFEC